MLTHAFLFFSYYLLFYCDILHTGAVSASSIFTISKNCTANTTPCGGPDVFSCCDPGLECNIRRGIPICQPAHTTSESGFDPIPCDDPYLYRCDDVVDVSGFCCPTGMSCMRIFDGLNAVKCIDAIGVTMPAFPSATTGWVPSVTPVSDNASSGSVNASTILYSPTSAWKTTQSNHDCTQSSSLHTTSMINASISLNYTGPSFMVHTVTSQNGGLFSLVVDGFNTSTFIDTYSTIGDVSLPTCYHLQFPAFATMPPGYNMTDTHVVTLVFVGRSPNMPAGGEPNIQFDGFSVPTFSVSASTNGEILGTGAVSMRLSILLIAVLVAMNVQP